jgi:hypothetical protein
VKKGILGFLGFSRKANGTVLFFIFSHQGTDCAGLHGGAGIFPTGCGQGATPRDTRHYVPWAHEPQILPEGFFKISSKTAGGFNTW